LFLILNAELTDAASRAVKNLDMAIAGILKQLVHDVLKEHHDAPRRHL
jgi:hypothetical protein